MKTALISLAIAVIAASPVAQTGDVLLAPDTADFDHAGWAVAVHGDRLAVGAHLADGPDYNTGALYVFERERQAWGPVARIEADEPILNDNLGESIALHGDVIVAGTAHSVGQIEFTGSAYVFRYDGADWRQEALLEPDTPQIGRRFGFAVDVKRNLIVVGAPGESLPSWKQGAVYVYLRVDDAWTLEEFLVPEDPFGSKQFGADVELDGERLAVGAPTDNTLGTNAGAAYVFRRGPGGHWIQEAKLLAPDGAANDELGVTVALGGRWLAVGARSDDDMFNSAGAAYIFERIDGDWTFTSKVTAPDPKPDAFFGRRVELTANRLVIASANPTGPFLFHLGAAYVYRRDADAWVFQTKLAPPQSLGEIEMGFDMGLSDNAVVCGAYLDDQASFDGGSVFVFDLVR